MPWFVTFVALPVDPWVVDASLATKDGKTLRDVFCKFDVYKDSVYFNPFSIDKVPVGNVID
jgi:hypothetical protein